MTKSKENLNIFRANLKVRAEDRQPTWGLLQVWRNVFSFGSSTLFGFSPRLTECYWAFGFQPVLLVHHSAAVPGGRNSNSTPAASPGRWQQSFNLMRLTVKKIIAREFLVACLIFIIGLITFGFTNLYNFYYNRQLNKIDEKIIDKVKLSDSLSSIFDTRNSKQAWLFAQMEKNFELIDDDSFRFTQQTVWDTLTSRAKKGDLQTAWNIKWKENFTPFFQTLGYKTCDTFQKFVLRNSITSIDSSNKERSRNIEFEVKELKKQEYNNRKKLISYSQRHSLTRLVVIVSLVVLFGVRYLFYGVKWSIETLKKKE